MGIEPLDIAIKDGRIVALLARGTVAETAEVIDATGKLVLPGAIDIHFHCRAPAYPQRGDFATETRAAAAGGKLPANRLNSKAYEPMGRCRHPFRWARGAMALRASRRGPRRLDFACNGLVEPSASRWAVEHGDEQ